MTRLPVTFLLVVSRGVGDVGRRSPLVSNLRRCLKVVKTAKGEGFSLTHDLSPSVEL